MEDLTAVMGLGTQYGTEVFAAAKDTQEALDGRRGVNWVGRTWYRRRANCLDDWRPGARRWSRSGRRRSDHQRAGALGPELLTIPFDAHVSILSR